MVLTLSGAVLSFLRKDSDPARYVPLFWDLMAGFSDTRNGNHS